MRQGQSHPHTTPYVLTHETLNPSLPSPRLFSPGFVLSSCLSLSVCYVKQLLAQAGVSGDAPPVAAADGSQPTVAVPGTGGVLDSVAMAKEVFVKLEDFRYTNKEEGGGG